MRNAPFAPHVRRREAVQGVLAAQQAIGEFNATRPPSQHCVVSGWGCSSGELLVLPGTDVHWGDPVNTGSKLGQDLAQDGELLLSRAAYDLLPADGAEPVVARELGIRFERRHLRRSGVDFECFAVTRSQADSG